LIIKKYLKLLLLCNIFFIKYYFLNKYNMKILIIFIVIILILIIFCFSNVEKMTNVKNQITPNNNTKCCLVEKKYLPDSNSINGGNFKYVYNSYENKNCDSSLYDIDNNKQLLIDGVNNWSNEMCLDKSGLGSCRMINKECVDFVNKDFCDKVPGMVWSERTCNNPLDYVWKDRIFRKIPEDNNDGSYNMFPEKLKKF